MNWIGSTRKSLWSWGQWEERFLPLSPRAYYCSGSGCWLGYLTMPSQAKPLHWKVTGEHVLNMQQPHTHRHTRPVASDASRNYQKLRRCANYAVWMSNFKQHFVDEFILKIIRFFTHKSLLKRKELINTSRNSWLSSFKQILKN